MSIIEVGADDKKDFKICYWSIDSLFFLAAVLILILGIQAYRNNEPLKIFGYTYSVVPTESMEPEIMQGISLLPKRLILQPLRLVMMSSIIPKQKIFLLFIVSLILAKRVH